MNKKNTVQILISILLAVVLIGCSQNNVVENMTEEQLVSLQMPVFEYINNDGVFRIHSGYIAFDELSGQFSMYLEANEEDGVDYEAYKEKIWENVGAKFNIIFELTPFPSVPTSSGVIRAIEYEDRNKGEGYIGTIVVVSQTSDSFSGNGEAYYDANSISVYENDPILNKKGAILTFDDLKIGMYVGSYYRGITLATYPGMQGTEKLVIHEDYQLPMASDSMSDTFIEEVLNNEDLTGPYPIVNSGYAREFLKDDARLWVHIDDGGIVFYKDKETLASPEAFMGSLLMHYVSGSWTDLEYKIPNVVIKASEEVGFAIEGDSITFIVTIYENGELQNAKYIINENGQLSIDN